MIKGKYVATIEVEFHIDENRPHTISFEGLREDVEGDKITELIYEALMEEVFYPDIVTLKVIPNTQYLYKEAQHE